MKIFRGLALAVPLLFLSACEEEASEPIAPETGGQAAGEVLGGTISDEMIPLEELTSTSPPAERQPSAPAGNASAAGEDATAPESEPAVPEPVGPITAGPERPITQAQEAEEPSDPPAPQ